MANTVRNTENQNKKPWPTWDNVSNEECIELARIIAKYVKFLHPNIIQCIVKDNESKRGFFEDYLSRNSIEPKLYLWDNSPCCFPGIRRHSGKQEIYLFKEKKSAKKKKIKINDAIALDDNSFPKQIWSFVFRGVPFNNEGPFGYTLAHLIDHKKNNNRMKKEFEFAEDKLFEKPFYGLFTCASNTIYIPSNLVKPTDFNGKIRIWLIKKAFSLYGSVCNLVPPFAKLKENIDSQLDEIKLNQNCIDGELNNVDVFLKYREDKIKKVLSGL